MSEGYEEEAQEAIPRVAVTEVPVESRVHSFCEVEKTVSCDAARLEARRCLRCDLEFTQRGENRPELLAGVEERA